MLIITKQGKKEIKYIDHFQLLDIDLILNDKSKIYRSID
jgi:hypothetical protein